MSFNVGSNALFRYDDKSGWWSVIVREVVTSGQTYVVETDGVVVPPTDLRPFDPIGNEGCIIKVHHGDLIEREEMPGDNEKRAIWAIQSNAIKQKKIKQEEDYRKSRWMHIVPGKRVSWKEDGGYDGATHYYTGVVNMVQDGKWFIIDHDGSQVLKGGYDLTVM